MLAVRDAIWVPLECEFLFHCFPATNGCLLNETLSIKHIWTSAPLFQTFS